MAATEADAGPLGEEATKRVAEAAPEAAFQVDLGPSLREVQQKRFAESNRESYSVLAYACKLKEGATLDRVAELHTQLIRSIMTKTAQRATGLLLLQRGAALHLIEAAYEFTSPFMRALADNPNTAELIESCSIVVKLEDKPGRAFKDWSCHSVNPPSEAVDLGSENLTDVSETVLQSLTQIGEQMRQEGKIAGPEFNSRFKNFFPSAERVVAMAESADFMPLADYIDFFEAPIKLEFDGDRTWPIQELISV
mmetsp:Transcript_44451/g.139418  ORF Transcript_44451/g.139418 Transcript_44451/m.139418 type:complete len:252 (-) Transcript_44451:127-882(-)